MRGIANGTQVTALPTPAAAVGTPGYCNNTTPGPGVTPTNLYPDDVNIVLAELLAILAAAGITPDATGANTAQVVAAIRALTFPTASGILSVSTSLTASQAGTFFNVGGTATTQTLPSAAAIGKSFGFYAVSAFTLASAGGLILGGGISASSVALAAGQFICVQADGANYRIFALDPSITGIGAAQSWQNVTGSRAFGTNYTNSTGRPIYVNIYASSSVANDHMNITIGGVVVPGAGSPASAFGVSMSVIVPAGATYSIAWNTGPLYGSFTWCELR